MAALGLARNVVWTYADVAGSAITQLVLVGYAARVLGAGAYGIFALVTAIVLIVAGLQFTFGFTVVGAAARVFAGNETGEERSDVAACHTAYCIIGGISFLLTTVAAVLVSGTGGHNGASAGSVGLLVFLVGAATTVGFIAATPAGVVRGAKDYRRLALSDLAGKAATLLVTVTLLKPVGLAALGVGQLTGQIVTGFELTRWSRREVPWLSVLPRGAPRAAVRRVLAAGLPLLAISVGGQVVGSTDLITVSALVGTTATGLYQLGSTLSVRFITALFQGYDVAFPYLAANSTAEEQERSTKLLTRGFGLVGGLGFGLLALYRTRLGVALAGGHAHAGLSDTVTILFCGIFAVNTCYHGLALMVISRGRQSVFTRLTVVEAALNVVFTILGVELIGAPGAAYASLLVVGVFNLVVLPLLVRGQLGSITPSFVVIDGLGSIAVGVGCAAVGALAAGSGFLNDLDIGTVVVAGIVGLGMAGICAVVMLPHARRAAVSVRGRLHPAAG